MIQEFRTLASSSREEDPGCESRRNEAAVARQEPERAKQFPKVFDFLCMDGLLSKRGTREVESQEKDESRGRTMMRSGEVM
jgi:hypothetical protein